MRYEKEHFTEILSMSKTLSDVARRLGLSPSKGNRDTIKKYIKLYEIDISHFEIRYRGNGENFNKKNLSDILVSNSTFSRTHLKARLYEEGIKERKCELCGQGEEWMGKKMSLILDHISGDGFDNRLENLRIVCPNCNATLDTNCSKNKTEYRNHLKEDDNRCIDCSVIIGRQSVRCGGCDHIRQRKSERPSYDVLSREVEDLGYAGVGRKYGVSDKSVKKWIIYYMKNK